MKKIFFFIYLVSTVAIFSTEYTLNDLENSSLWSKKVDDEATYYTKKHNGKVPILCFHKISDDLRYGITADNFEDLLVYLNKNNYHLINDRDFLNRDFSKVPSGFTPIVMGSDDASEGNFLYETVGESETGIIDLNNDKAVISKNTMVSLLNKHIKPIDGKINFTFYIAFKGMPFRQTGGELSQEKNYRGYNILQQKFNYLLDNFYLGVHTITHPVTKETPVKEFEWELNEFYSVMYTYLGDNIKHINTLAYPHGCAELKPEMQQMIESFSFKGATIMGGFDFDGYFSKPPFFKDVNDYDVSRIGVDNKNIKKIYWFLENVPLFKTERVIVVDDISKLSNITYNDNDKILVVK